MTILAVTDTETTGFENHDQIVELAIEFVDPARPRYRER
jgi:hypothetical protein